MDRKNRFSVVVYPDHFVIAQEGNSEPIVTWQEGDVGPKMKALSGVIEKNPGRSAPRRRSPLHLRRGDMKGRKNCVKCRKRPRRGPGTQTTCKKCHREEVAAWRARKKQGVP